MKANAMKKAIQKKQSRPATPLPGRESLFELGAVTVADPDEKGAKIRVPANIRHDVMVHWKSRKQIDEAQFLAGQKLQNIWYQAGTGMPGSVRYNRQRVDVSGGSDPFPERVAAASAELRELAAFLGRADYRLLIHVLCVGHRIEDVAREFGGREPQLYIARRVRDALGYLADYWGAQGKRSVPMRAMQFEAPLAETCG